jgi:hypothetical protein
MLSDDFLVQFKSATEANWAGQSIDPTRYGGQFQCGMRWNGGLNKEMIDEYESALQARFPHDFRAFLRDMNGTGLAMPNVYSSCGEPHCEVVRVYAYPRDLAVVRDRIEHIRPFCAENSLRFG